jgi:Fe2+ transport system protein FeoA
MKTMPAAPLATFLPADGELEVVEVLAETPAGDGNSRRLCELGVCPGKRIKLARQGDPAIVCIGESRFALGAELQARVFVRPTA